MFSSNFPIRSEGGDASFQNNVPDPVTSGKALPTFKFALEKSEGRVMRGSYGKEATVAQLPISKGLAGVSMRMEPGVMRELHWHATAAEWAFVTEGSVRTTVVDPDGCSGFQYAFDIEKTRAEEDLVVTRDGASVIVDPVSLEMIKGSELDFVDDLMGQAFKVKNPNAVASCGCGVSFSI